MECVCATMTYRKRNARSKGEEDTLGKLVNIDLHFDTLVHHHDRQTELVDLGDLQCVYRGRVGMCVLKNSEEHGWKASAVKIGIQRGCLNQ